VEKPKHVSIKFAKDLHYKLHFIAKYEGRSANGQILFLLRKNIKEFEAENGEIILPADDEAKSSRSTNRTLGL